MANKSPGDEVLIAEYLDGWETLDQEGFCLNLSALSADGRLPIEQLVGAPMLLDKVSVVSHGENLESP